MDLRFVRIGRAGPGPWGYEIEADTPVDERCCPLCFRAYSDYEVTAVVPCWPCRDTVSLADIGPISVQVWEDMPQSLAGVESAFPDGISEEAEFYFDEQKDSWILEEIRLAAIALRSAKEKSDAEFNSKSGIYGAKSKILKKRAVAYETNNLDRAREKLRLHREGYDVSVAYRRSMREYYDMDL